MSWAWCLPVVLAQVLVTTRGSVTTASDADSMMLTVCVGCCFLGCSHGGHLDLIPPGLTLLHSTQVRGGCGRDIELLSSMEAATGAFRPYPGPKGVQI